jgi:hypothetical protein
MRMLSCGVNSESFRVGARIAPAGAPPALRALRAMLAGDVATAERFAQQAMDADRYANAERADGRTARRSNIVGNAWSYWFECFTGRPSGR